MSQSKSPALSLELIINVKGVCDIELAWWMNVQLCIITVVGTIRLPYRCNAFLSLAPSIGCNILWLSNVPSVEAEVRLALT